jgi:hypothetical protein
MLQDIILRYESFGDALISKISYERNIGDNGKVEVTLNTMNALNDYEFEYVKLVFIDIVEIRFVEAMNTSSLVLNTALIFEESDIITFDFFPLIYATDYKEDPNSDFKIKCRKVEYDFLGVYKPQ